MTNKKFATGAFVFTRTRAYVPRNPEDVIPLAAKHGFDASIVPDYAGDRAAIGRAIAKTDTKIAGVQYLLRPLKRSGSELSYAIVREDKCGEDHLDHTQETKVSWRAEPNPAVIEGDHTIANRVRLAYAELRGKLVADDWTATVTRELERLGAVPFREDGRVYWCPPQSLEAVRRLQSFLAEVGVIVVVAEVEAENTGVVTEIVSESVADQLHALALEVEAFDGVHQKPGTYARRLEEYQHLRERAILYRGALGVGVDKTVEVLSELERKVSEMLELRTKTVVHRDGSVDTIKASDAPETPALDVLTFAGARFTKADSDTDELLFVSADERAVSSVRALESMGLAGTWQNAGSVQVSVQNSGPPGAETSIRLRVPSGMDGVGVARSLATLGIGVVAA